MNTADAPHHPLVPLPSAEDALIPAHQMPRYIGIAQQTAARWRCEGQGPAFIKVGRRIFYRAGDVRQWLQSRRRAHTD